MDLFLVARQTVRREVEGGAAVLGVLRLKSKPVLVSIMVSAMQEEQQLAITFQLLLG